jgi:putative endonuclease
MKWTRTKPEPHRLGQIGEDAAASWLQRAGFRILNRNLNTKIGEIDILGQKPGLLVAFEVKTSRHHPAPEWGLTPAQLGRLKRTLLALATTMRPKPTTLRIDVLSVRAPNADKTPLVEHFPGEEFYRHNSSDNL